MYSVSVRREFCAAHALRVAGHVEPTHGHNWLVTVRLEGAELDEDGLLCDFHTVEDALDGVIDLYHNRNLNDIAPFVSLNPTAEHVARHIAESLIDRLEESLRPHARLASVSVTEAPGCTATYTP